MSLLTELFGEEAINWDLSTLKAEINKLPRVQKERYSYLLHDWGAINNVTLTDRDYLDVGGIPQQK
jgi:hypothetical protein